MAWVLEFLWVWVFGAFKVLRFELLGWGWPLAFRRLGLRFGVHRL